MINLIETIAIGIAIVTVITVIGSFIAFMRYISYKERKLLDELKQKQEVHPHA